MIHQGETRFFWEIQEKTDTYRTGSYYTIVNLIKRRVNAICFVPPICERMVLHLTLTYTKS